MGVGGTMIMRRCKRGCSFLNPPSMQPMSRRAPSIHDADAVDHFDRIPDSLLLLIFNKLADVRSLRRCAAVSTRFNALVPLVHDLHLRIDRVGPPPPPSFVTRPSISTSRPPRSPLISSFSKLLLSILLKPFRSKSYHSPEQVLKSFTHVRNLRVQLPAGDVATGGGVLLRWKAEFGSTLQNCVVVGGTTMMDQRASATATASETIPETFRADGELKLRVVWTIGSLIAASTRHHLVRRIIEDHPTLESLVLTDADGQGTLSMGAEQLKDLRQYQKRAPAPAPAPASNRTQVPATNMKLRYASRLELPGGLTLQVATMVAIEPSNINVDGSSMEADDAVKAFASGALDHFDEPFRAAANALMKTQSYHLEMNGF